jgi:hypothetical protein
MASLVLPAFVGQNVQAGINVKNVVGEMSISFPVPFQQIPIVVVSSNFPEQVGYVEAISNVTPYDFTVSSANCSPNYAVSWAAYGAFPAPVSTGG